MLVTGIHAAENQYWIQATLGDEPGDMIVLRVTPETPVQAAVKSLARFNRLPAEGFLDVSAAA